MPFGPAGPDIGESRSDAAPILKRPFETALDLTRQPFASSRQAGVPDSVRIRSARRSGLVVKKIKLADGSAISTAGAPEADAIGISDDLIMKYDTMMVPVSQFEFTDAEIDDKFDSDPDYILKGYISSVTKNDIRIKFDGDTHVSSYPRQGFGQFVRRLQYRDLTTKVSLECTKFSLHPKRQPNLVYIQGGNQI